MPRVVIVLLLLAFSMGCEGGRRPSRSEVVEGDATENLDGGSCIDTQSDPENCGACGVVCPAPPGGAGRRCVAGVCVATCPSGRADCDGDIANGCEADLATSTQHCGACGRSCGNVANANPACGSGSCVLACQAGFDDCDMYFETGCETRVTTDVDNCGACGLRCPWPSRTVFSCEAMACAQACRAGYLDCDSNRDNGCEVAALSARNCGACGNVCAGDDRYCADDGTGARCMRVCPAGTVDCDFSCVRTDSDPDHCGRCGNRCPDGSNAQGQCTEGRCTLECRVGTADCDADVSTGCEVSLRSDRANCGACGRTCAALEFCADGVCFRTPPPPTTPRALPDEHLFGFTKRERSVEFRAINPFTGLTRLITTVTVPIEFAFPTDAVAPDRERRVVYFRAQGMGTDTLYALTIDDGAVRSLGLPMRLLNEFYVDNAGDLYALQLGAPVTLVKINTGNGALTLLGRTILDRVSPSLLAYDPNNGVFVGTGDRTTTLAVGITSRVRDYSFVANMRAAGDGHLYGVGVDRRSGGAAITRIAIEGALALTTLALLPSPPAINGSGFDPRPEARRYYTLLAGGALFSCDVDTMASRVVRPDAPIAALATF